MRFIILAALVCAVFAAGMDDVVITQDLVDSVNRAKTTWTASADQGAFFQQATRGQLKQLMGVRKSLTRKLPRISYRTEERALPNSFDAATQWPQCKTINMIRDQSACGSCWAFGAAEAISDRYCTYSKTPINVSISAADLLACCDECGMGCGGGDPDSAWQYWTESGLATEDCDPYPFPKCEHHTTGKYPVCPKQEYDTPVCNSTCTGTGSWTLHKGSKAYSLSGASDFQAELYAHGPFEVAFTVYEDFVTYKSGVYHHVSGAELGGHAVKLVGWGILNGTKYWKIANSWNEDWGAQGFFLIKRGNDECGIEDEGSAGQPAPF